MKHEHVSTQSVLSSRGVQWRHCPVQQSAHCHRSLVTALASHCAAVRPLGARLSEPVQVLGRVLHLRFQTCIKQQYQLGNNNNTQGIVNQ